MSIARASSSVIDRAENDMATLTYTEENTLLIQLGDGDVHILDTDGTTASGCTCEYQQYSDNPCSHMVAYENWNIDLVSLPGKEIKL